MTKGTIKKLMDNGFGFIKTEEERDLFSHRNEIEGAEFSSLGAGQEPYRPSVNKTGKTQN